MEYDVNNNIPYGRITPVMRDSMIPKVDIVYEDFGDGENEKKDDIIKNMRDLDIEEDIPNNTDKRIDFQSQLDAYKKRT